MEKVPLGTEIHWTANCIDNFIANFLSKKVDTELTAMEGITLKIIYKKGETLTAADIMQATDLSKATTSQTLSSLERKGLLRMEKQKEDKRRKLIKLTEKGKRAVMLLEGAFQSIRKVIEADISPEEKEAFGATLEKIRNNVSGKGREEHEK